MTTAPVVSVTDELLADLEERGVRHGYIGASTVAAILAERADLKRQLAEAVDGSGAMRLFVLLCDIRTACGDDGKRMQPELVEYIGELKRDSERFRLFAETVVAECRGEQMTRTQGALFHSMNTMTRVSDVAELVGLFDNAMEATK